MKELKETNWKEKYEKEHKLRQEAEKKNTRKNISFVKKLKAR